jgi:arylsulfatase
MAGRRAPLIAVALVASCLSHDGSLPRPALPSRYSLIEHLGEAEVESSPSAGVEARAVAVGGDERPSILTPSPARVRFKGVWIGPAARLRFGAGLAEGAGGRAVRLAVGIAAGDEAAVRVWTGTLRSPAEGWADTDVDLGHFADRRVDLVLSAETIAGQGGAAAWSLPVLRAARARGPAGTVDARRVERDLLGDRTPPVDPGSFVGYGRVLQATQRALVTGPQKSRYGEPLQVRMRVPEGASLRLGGEVLRQREGAAVSVRFRATLDDAPIWSRHVRDQKAPAAFFEDVPLRAGGRDRLLRLEIENPDPQETIAWWTSAWLVRAEPRPRQPASRGRNLLLIMVDTLRADHLGVYGYRRDTSPNLDRLAAQGLVFDRAFSSCSWTQPAVASVLTGLAPTEHGVVGGTALSPAFETLGETLQRQGFGTIGLSASPIVGSREGFQRGFETFVQIPWARAPRVNEVFADWLRENRDSRWFAYLQYVDPHDAYDAPEPYGTMFTGAHRLRAGRTFPLLRSLDFDQPRVSLDPGELEYLRGAYDGEIRYWDAGLGALVETLRKTGVLENTVIVVTADHGEEFLEHGRLFHGPHLYDESIRVPLVVWAAGAGGPARVDRLVETRSIGALARRMIDAGGAGWSAVDVPGPETAFSETSMGFHPGRREFRTLAAAREADWKYVLAMDDGAEELYDLRRDPGERVNRAAAEPARRARYRRLLEEWLGKKRSAPSSWRDPGLLERLRAAGYIQ